MTAFFCLVTFLIAEMCTHNLKEKRLIFGSQFEMIQSRDSWLQDRKGLVERPGGGTLFIPWEPGSKA